METMEDAQAAGQLNQILENSLSSVEITHKVEMKTGKSFTEWKIKAKHEDVFKAKGAVIQIDNDLRQHYDKQP